MLTRVFFLMALLHLCRFATEAAITILRIDDSITMQAQEKPKGPVGDHY
jgi:hypothetical protein